jgi:hypothetical protein
VAAIIVTDIPGTALIAIVVLMTGVVVGLAATQMRALRPDFGSAQVQAQGSVALAMEAIRQRVGAPAEEVDEDVIVRARTHVDRFASASAQRLSIVARARFFLQVAIALGIAVVGLLFPSAGLGALASTAPGEAAATVLVVVLLIRPTGLFRGRSG